MALRPILIIASLCSLISPAMRAEEPALLAGALQRWASEQGELAFTQQARAFSSDGRVREERIERYDPSLPDSQRWRLIEVNGVAATDEQRKKWETRKNSRPRTKVDESPSKYLDLDHAVLIGETPLLARFRVPVLPQAQRLLAVEEIDIILTVDRRSGSIAGIGAALREPMRVLLGLVRITDLDVDIRINPGDDSTPHALDDVLSGSTARVKISKLGSPMEYNWSDFKRVAPFASR